MFEKIIDDSFVSEQWINSYLNANKGIYEFKIVRPDIVEWVESNIYLPRTSTDYSGRFNYDLTPYWREPAGHAHPNSPVRTCSIMKSVQSGATESVIIPIICYKISEDPCSILLTAGDLALAKDTVEKRLDPVLLESNLTHLLRAHVTKKSNNRSGDTSASKEFVGGSFYAKGTQSATAFRQFPAKLVLADDYDAAPAELGKEGSTRGLIEGRQNSFGDRAMIYFISTPTITQTSNIYALFLLGTQKRWQWPCGNCSAYMQIDFKIELADGNKAGIVYILDGKGRLKRDTVGYMCPHCGHVNLEKQKYDLNKNGIWVPGTTEPVEFNHESYHFNGLAMPAGMTTWVKIVEEYIQAFPNGEEADHKKAKTLYNLRFGLPYAEQGVSLNITELMKNTRAYLPGIIPDATCEADGNGKIVLITMSIDINGWMTDKLEDVRLDWEILAHCATGQNYSIDHGSIGTFKRAHELTAADKAKESDREKWTITHNVKNSVWPEVEKIMATRYKRESMLNLNETGKPMGDDDFGTRMIDITVVDTGHGEKLATIFVEKMQMQGYFIYGIKGRVEDNYRPLKRDSNPVVRSKERPQVLYIAEVNQIKDDLAANMRLRSGDDGSQPAGFMNYPQSHMGKYEHKSFFTQYEQEQRVEVKNGDNVIGYKWEKKNSTVANHFWDVRVYNNAATLVYLDIFKRSDPKFKDYSWEDFVLYCTT